MQASALLVYAPLPLVILLGACAGAGDPPEGSAGPVVAAAPVYAPGVMDRAPGRRTRVGEWDVRVAEGGGLSVRRVGDEPKDVVIDVEVDPRVAVSGDTLVYARRGEWGETDLWRVALPDGTPTRLTDWTGSEDRPVVSPDGERVAFVSGRTGLASWWVMDLAGGEARQITNVGVTRGQPGRAPAGWVPVPDGVTYRWTDRLVWVAEGREYAVEVPR